MPYRVFFQAAATAAAGRTVWLTGTFVVGCCNSGDLWCRHSRLPEILLLRRPRSWGVCSLRLLSVLYAVLVCGGGFVSLNVAT